MLSDELQKAIKLGFQQALPEGRLHFAAHSHHPWPDVTENAQNQYWKDSVQLLDSKWAPIFANVIPQSKKYLCEMLGLPSPAQIVEGTSSFELVTRIFSSFDLGKPFRVLTTDHEFYSFERFARRLDELANVTVDRVATEPFESFEDRFEQALESQSYDVVFSSLVFYNSGFYADRLLEKIARFADRSTIIVDIYHAGGAVPLGLAAYANSIYFVGGGYKYLSAGEGACFLSAPASSRLRPLMTGWLSEYGALKAGLGENVGYPEDASRFAGATYDPSGWYRFNAVMEWWKALGLETQAIHRHVRALQEAFIERSGLTPIGFDAKSDWGHFLAFPVANAQKIADALRSEDVFVDARDGYLRVGFGYYQSLLDVEGLVDALGRHLP